jgi:pyruvate kinase
MRRAKIVATLGPSSQSVQQIENLINAGLDVARINMSHGTHEGHAQVIQNVRKASINAKKEVGILLDLQGPKIRVDKLPNPLQLKKGEIWVIGPTHLKNQYPQFKDNFIPTTYDNLVQDSQVGCSILFDDGLIQAKAVEKVGDVLKIEILVDGELKSNKGINLPDINISAPSLTVKDKEDLMFGLSKGVDFIALSFVRTRQDIQLVKNLLHGLKMNIPVVAKIERPEAVDNIKEIIDVTDVIMIARGDMGVELGNHLVPPIQKKIISLCNEVGRPVITATQMLESMITNNRPTRAEASDVANAIWDGTDAVMLSGETASGKYPVETIMTMDRIIKEAERIPKERPLIRQMDLSGVSVSMQVAASLIAEKTTAKWIISLTQTGRSCLNMSRFRPKTRVLGVTNSIEIVRRMCLYWGVTPYLYDTYQQTTPEDVSVLERKMIEVIQHDEFITNGDKIVITHGGGKFFSQTSSHSIRVEIIQNAILLPKNQSHDDILDEAKLSNGGKILLDTQICASCQNCVSVCPHEIWAVTPDASRNTYIDKDKAQYCTLDLACVDECPTGAIEIIIPNN